MNTVNWKGGLAFEAKSESGLVFTMDSDPEGDEERLGPSPVEALLCSAAACSAMDVISILVKMRQRIDSYQIEISYDRIPPGTWPRTILSMNLKHIIQGQDVESSAVQKAVELSDEKYCSVIASLRSNVKVTSEWVIQ